MDIVIITAFGVGGATIVGALIGYFFKELSHKSNDIILGFAAGVMLSAACYGLILPAIDSVKPQDIWIPVVGIAFGAVFLALSDRLTPHLHSITGMDCEAHANNSSLNKILLFVIAIAIHNFPEGLAAGVAFGTGDISDAITVATGIALQNIPEGMIVVTPLLMCGLSRRRAFAIAAATGVIEIVGTFVGYFAISISAAILPFALAFAGGTMIYVISDEMIPETHSHGYERAATYSILFGFVTMMIIDKFV